MTNIKTDVESLSKVHTRLSRAISDIHSTKSSMISSYKRMGGKFTDKKYEELGVILNECAAAMDQILSALSDADKKLKMLEKNVIEYEDINIGDRGSAHFGDVVRKKSDQGGMTYTAKEKAFNKGMKKIDKIIDKYAAGLERRGMQPGQVMNNILNFERITMEAALLRQINTGNSNPVSILTSAQLDAIAANADRFYGNVNQEGGKPRKLDHTEYGFTEQVIDGKRLTVYDDPVGTHAGLIHDQRNYDFDMIGTCGLCQCVNILRMAGVNVTVNDVISVALHGRLSTFNELDLFASNPEERGSTSADGRQEIMEAFGLETSWLQVSHDRDWAVREMAQAIRTGHGVIASVHGNFLWDCGRPTDNDGHAISLISVTEDGNTFIYNDTGSENGTLHTISAERLSWILTGRPANVTINVIR